MITLQTWARASVSVAILVTAAACGGGDDGIPDPEQGGVRGKCFADGTCNPTLTCVDGICLGGVVDAAMDATGPVDTPPDSLVCDTQFEPNETTAAAHALAFTGTAASLMNLMVCPTGDIDMFSLTATGAGTSIVATVTYTAITPSAVGAVAILDAAGVLVASGQVTGANAQTATASGRAAGTYYVRVLGNGTFRYKLDVTRTP